jgi:TRAP-type C4-dicarboxylate transport system substrate-binding protein
LLPTLSAAAQELRISHQFHAENDSRGRAAHVLAAEVTRRAPDLKISIHPQLSIGLTRDGQLHALQSGHLDFAVLPSIAISKRVREFSLALLPGLVPTLATARALKGSQVHARFQSIAAAHELRIVTWWWKRGGFATTKVGAISPASVSGLGFQSWGLMQDLQSGAGALRGDDPASEIPIIKRLQRRREH